MKTVTICSSAAFYEHANKIADQLEAQRYKVIVPATAHKMRTSGDYNVDHYKTWYENEDDFTKKRQLMDQHFAEVEKGDAILVINDRKHDIDGYIGPNVLMEMAIAYHLKKPIFVLNTVGKDVSVYEEVVGMGAIQLGGDIKKLEL